MSLRAATGAFTTSTTETVGTAKDIVCGFQPDLIFFFGAGRSAIGLLKGNLFKQFGVGVSDTQRWALVSRSQDQQGTSITRYQHSDQQVFLECGSSSTPAIASLDLAARAQWPVDGFRLVVDQQFGTNFQGFYLALNGSEADFEHLDVGTLLVPTSAATPSTVTLGYQPDGVMLAGGQTTASRTGGLDDLFSVGVSDGTDSWALSNMSDTAAADMVTRRYFRTGEAFVTIDRAAPSAANNRATCAFGASGFTLNWAEVSGGSATLVFYLAWKGPKTKVGSFLTRTSTGAIAVSDVGFPPKALLTMSVQSPAHAADTPQAQDIGIIGAFTSATDRRFIAWRDEDGPSTSDIAEIHSASGVYGAPQRTSATLWVANYGASVTSLDAGGFTLNQDEADVNASLVGYIAFGNKLQTFSITGSGGVASAGAAAMSNTKALTAEGGLTASGAADLSVTTVYRITGSGGAQAGGAAMTAREYAWRAVGSAVMAGVATIALVISTLAAGGAVLGGEALYAKEQAIVAQGGALVAGEAVAEGIPLTDPRISIVEGRASAQDIISGLALAGDTVYESAASATPTIEGFGSSQSEGV